MKTWQKKIDYHLFNDNETPEMLSQNEIVKRTAKNGYFYIYELIRDDDAAANATTTMANNNPMEIDVDPVTATTTTAKRIATRRKTIAAAKRQQHESRNIVTLYHRFLWVSQEISTTKSKPLHHMFRAVNHS